MEKLLKQLRTEFPSISDEALIEKIRPFASTKQFSALGPMEWFAARCRWAEEQKPIVSKIKKCGGTVSYDFMLLNECGMELDESPAIPAPESYVSLLGLLFFTEIVGVGFLRNINDKELARMRDLRYLQYLCFGDSQISDAGLETIGRFTELRYLRKQLLRSTENFERKKYQKAIDALTNFEIIQGGSFPWTQWTAFGEALRLPGCGANKPEDHLWEEWWTFKEVV